MKLYDTQSRDLKEIVSTNGILTMYCCGPTVYRDAHVGNLRTFMLADLISRTVALSGVKVRLIQNITDVGHMSEDFAEVDKILSQATIEKVSALEIARKYEEKFHSDLSQLNIGKADAYPRASESIDLMQSMIAELIHKGFAYVGGDKTVYFDARKFDGYGDISGNKLDSLQPGHRYEYHNDGAKKFHADWALWKTAGERSEMIWDSPWGPGFPGWHIECSAMSMDLLEKHVDVHVGGIDLRFPHHENERAQSNAVIGHEAVDVWVHGEHLLFEGKKMSKSSGNVVLVSDIVARGIDPLALRLCFLENRYRSQMDLTWNSINAAHETLKRWRSKMSEWGHSTAITVDPEMESAFKNDLDTPKVILRLREIEKSEVTNKRELFMFADQVLALDLDRPIAVRELTEQMQTLIDERAKARIEKRWADSDSLRVQLESLGLHVIDTSDGQIWT
jgi:cysteinyl-tRNA synthetase